MSDKNPLLALSGNIGDRFVKLSQQKQEPDIWYSERSLYKLRFGMDFHEYQEGEEETSEMAPILTMRHRIKTREEALKLQLSYRTLHTRFAKRTPYSQRLELAHGATHKDKTGAVCAYIVGLVTDFATFADGRLARICLTSPFLVEKPGMANGKPFDSHIWLHVDRLHVDGDYADPADPDPRVHNQNQDLSGVIHIGELLTVAARINTYVDSQGRKRLGAGEWSPLTAALIYGYTGADGRSLYKHVPMHLLKHLRLLKIESDGTARWADPHMLTCEVENAERKYPKSAGEMRLTHDVPVGAAA